LLSPLQCHAAFSTIPSTLAWVDQSPVSQHVSWQPPSGRTVHNCYRPPPRDPGRAEYESTIPQGTDEGLDLWETILILISRLTLQMALYKHSVVVFLILAPLMFVSKTRGWGWGVGRKPSGRDSYRPMISDARCVNLYNYELRNRLCIIYSGSLVH